MERELTQLEYTNENSPHLKRDRKKKSKAISIMLFLISILVWGGLLYGGYYVATQYINSTEKYIDERLAVIQKSNTENMKELDSELQKVNDELLSIKSELVFIQEDLALTGETLNGTDETKMALQERIKALDTQLTELQKSISRLEDASQ